MPATDADEDAVEADADDATAEEPPPPSTPRSTNAPVLVAVGAAVLFGLVALALVIVVVRDRNKSDTNADRTEISTTAARVAEAITAVDASGNGVLASTVDQLGTAPVVEQYKEISGTIRKELGTFKLTSIKGTVKEVYVGNIESAEARVIIRLDLVFVGDNTRVVPDQYLDMTLAKLDGTWKVDNVRVLNVALSGGAPSTTVPTSTSSSTG